MTREPPRIERLVGLASVLVDVTLTVPALPPRGGDVLAAPGGRAAGGGINALVAAARLGLRSAYAGRHGTGPNGDLVRETLAHEGITPLHGPEAGADTGWCLALVEPDGERTFVTAPGVEATLDAAVLASLDLHAGDALYVSGYDLAYPGSGPALGPFLAGLPDRRSGGPYVVLDPGPLAGEVPRSLLAQAVCRADLVTASASELAPLAPLRGAAPGDTALLDPSRTAVLERRGAQGAVLHLPDAEPLAVPASPAPGPVVDTNGAGDTHLGALLAGLHHGLDWPGALHLAARAAAFSVTRPGAASGPTHDDLEAATDRS